MQMHHDCIHAVSSFPRFVASPTNALDADFLARLVATAEAVRIAERHVSQFLYFTNAPYVANPAGSLLPKLVEICDLFREAELSPPVGIIRDLLIGTAPMIPDAMRLDRGLYNGTLHYHRADVPPEIKVALLAALVGMLGFSFTAAMVLDPAVLEGVEMAALTDFAWADHPKSVH